jgi:hypothetical protein
VSVSLETGNTALSRSSTTRERVLGDRQYGSFSLFLFLCKQLFCFDVCQHDFEVHNEGFSCELGDQRNGQNEEMMSYSLY